MATHSRRRNRKKSKRSHYSRTWIVTNFALLALYAILAGLTIYFMYSYNILAFRYVNVIYTVILALILLISLFLIIRKKGKRVTSVLLVVFSIISAITLFAFKSIVDVADTMNKTASYSEIEMSIVVPADSDISDVTELASVQAPVNADGTNINTLISHISSDKGVDLSIEEVDSYQAAYENLISGTSQAMVLNSAYSSLLELSYSDYEANLKAIYTYTIKTEVSAATESADSNVFNIYISGIDTYGSISTVSRSDVNIILTVNMTTHKILMTTTPRDAYVQIPDGGADQYDKLTHAGIYGVETSMKALENLYGINIDYYARINFTSFMNLIDALGGITVYNDQAFTSYTNSNYSFEAGEITLSTGEEALAFVRERYNLENGDYDRGENQMKVIQAIINKLTSFSSVSSYSAIISSLQDSVQTNMTLETMMSLANTQLDSGSSFSITSQEVTGIGSTGELTSYAMPNASLYMIQLDDSSVANASQAIKDVMEGN